MTFNITISVERIINGNPYITKDTVTVQPVLFELKSVTVAGTSSIDSVQTMEMLNGTYKNLVLELETSLDAMRDFSTKDWENLFLSSGTVSSTELTERGKLLKELVTKVFVGNDWNLTDYEKLLYELSGASIEMTGVTNIDVQTDNTKTQTNVELENSNFYKNFNATSPLNISFWLVKENSVSGVDSYVKLNTNDKLPNFSFNLSTRTATYVITGETKDDGTRQDKKLDYLIKNFAVKALTVGESPMIKVMVDYYYDKAGIPQAALAPSDYADNKIYQLEYMFKLVIIDNSTYHSFPEEEVTRIYNTYTETYKQYAEMYGVDYDTFLSEYVGTTDEELHETSRLYVREDLTLYQLVKELEVKISDEEYQAGCELYAQQAGVTVDQFLEYYDEDTIKLSLLYEKVLMIISDSAEVIENK